MQSLGYMVSHFPQMSLTNNPIHTNGFAQNWTIYFWSYWMVWCVATPFFIGTISKGRTIRQTVFGGYFFGLAGTFTSFIILGNYGIAAAMASVLTILTIISLLIFNKLSKNGEITM